MTCLALSTVVDGRNQEVDMSELTTYQLIKYSGMLEQQITELENKSMALLDNLKKQHLQ